MPLEDFRIDKQEHIKVPPLSEMVKPGEVGLKFHDAGHSLSLVGREWLDQEIISTIPEHAWPYFNEALSLMAKYVQGGLVTFGENNQRDVSQGHDRLQWRSQQTEAVNTWLSKNRIEGQNFNDIARAFSLLAMGLEQWSQVKPRSSRTMEVIRLIAADLKTVMTSIEKFQQEHHSGVWYDALTTREKFLLAHHATDTSSRILTFFGVIMKPAQPLQ